MAAAAGAVAGKGMDRVGTEEMLREEIGTVLGDNTFDASKVQNWCQEVVSGVLKKLVEANKSQDFQYKYVVNATILERTGAGLHSTSSCLWDKTADWSASVQWNNDHMFCVTSVWSLRCN